LKEENGGLGRRFLFHASHAALRLETTGSRREHGVGHRPKGKHMTATLFPWMRTLHILFAASWFGAAAVLTLYLLPVLRQLGAAGETTLQGLTGRGLHRFMAASSGITVLSGLWLYWTLTAGFSASAMSSTAGMVFGLGGLAGLLAAMLGGGVIGRSIQRIEALSASGADPAQIAGLHQRIAMASRLALALLAFALLAMALGHLL
jgi:uncharacterized membrane protein